MLASQPLARRSSGVKLEEEGKAGGGKNVDERGEGGAPDWGQASDPWLRKSNALLYESTTQEH